MGDKSSRTRDRILRAAAEVLASRGYGATTLEAIAELAEMKAGSLYYHFASKDRLVTEVLLEGVRTADVAVERAVADLGPSAPPLAQLRAAVHAHLDAIVGQGPFTKANIRSYGQVPAEVAEEVRAAQRAYGDRWRGLVDGAMAAGEVRRDLDPTAVRLLLLGAMNWSVEWLSDEGPSDAATLADALLDMAFDGLRPRGDLAPPGDRTR